MDNKEKSPEQELIESIGLMIEKGMESNTNIYTGVVKSVDGKRAVVAVNGQNQNVSIATADVSSGNVVRVFVPEGNMSAAFIIKAEASGGGGPTTTAYGDLTGKPQINGVTLVDNKTSKELNLYGTGNEPPYPVTSVNGQTGDVTIEVGGNVDSVNGKTGAVVLSAADVGALPSTTIIPDKTSQLDNDSGYITNSALTGYAKKTEIPTKTSELTNDSGYITNTALEPYAKTVDIPTKTSQLNNDSGYITANDVPVKSVDGATGDVVTNAVKTTTQTLTNAQKQQARTNIGAGTSSFDGDYNSLTNKPTIPTKTSQLTNDSGFITNSALTGYAKTTDIPTKTSQLDNDSHYITASEAPVQSVNTKTGAVVLTQDDVGDGTTYVRTHNDFTDALKTQINTNKDDIAMLDGDVEGLQTDVGALKTNVTSLQTSLTGKQDVIVGAASTITEDNLATDRALVSNSSGKVAVSNVTSTELGYLDGVTSNVQTQLDKKLEKAPVTSVNSKTGAVQLNASDVGALPDTTVIPSKTSQLDNDSGFISDIPIASATQLGGVKVGAGLSVTENGVLSATGGGTADAVEWNNVIDKPTTIAGYGITDAKIENGTITLGNQTITPLTSAPVTSVNSKTGAVVLGASDVGAISTSNISQTLGTSTTKVPSEKAVSDALSSAGFGDMLKSTYDPTGSVATAGGIPDYVEANGGKIDTIKVNGTAQVISDKTVNITVPTKTSDITNDSGYLTSAPVTSVNSKTGGVNLTASDVGAVSTDNITQTLGTSTTKVPSEKAVSDAIVAAGGGSGGSGVNSVNGKTGDVVLNAADVSALPNTTVIPSKTSQLTNDSGFITDKEFADKVSKSGDTMTGKLTVPQVETGAGNSNFFQCRKFRGEGDADTYYHAIDFGYKNHDQVDFHEYGGTWNFYKNQSGKVNGGVLCGKITNQGWEGHAILKNNSTSDTTPLTENSNVIATTAFVHGLVDNVKHYSANNPPPYPVTSVNGKTGAVTLGKSDVGLGSVDNVKQYSASNPPPYPVKSVNGHTGAVTLTASDIGAATTNDIHTALNRTNAVNVANSNYTTYMARGEALFSSETTPTVNGCIAWVYG